VSGFRSGFVSLVGRPNVGKSTLLNRMVGEKVSIVSDRPQTTRTEVRGVRTTPDAQVVFLDTPGVHKPRTLLGERCNQRSLATLAEVDVVCLLLDATAAVGPGDRFIAEAVARVRTPCLAVVNKVDAARKGEVVARLAQAAALQAGFAEYFPVSARTGEGIDELQAAIEALLPEGPLYYPDGMVTDAPEALLVAERVREKLLALTRDELPHSIMVTAERIDDDPHDDADGGDGDDGDDAGDHGAGGRGRGARGEERDDEVVRYRVAISVERDSQKGMVIGRGGSVLKQAGTAARLELEPLLGARLHIESRVRVEPHWQRRAHALDRLGL